MIGPTALAVAPWLSAPRVRRLALVFMAVALISLMIDVWVHTRAGVTSMAGKQLAQDFVNYWAGGHLAAQGNSNRVYNINGFLAWQRAHTAANAEFKWYSYPPVTLLLSLPLGFLSFKAGLAAWWLAGWLGAMLLLARLLDWRSAILAAFATPASLINALAGQNGQFSAIMLCGGVLLLETSPVAAGALFGLLCFKPQLAILIPVALAAGGYWRAFIAAAITVLSLLGASLSLFGVETWLAFRHTAPINILLMEQGDTLWHRMPTVFAMTRLMGGSIMAGYGLQIISSVAAAGLTAFLWRSGADTGRKGAALVLATFLATPYAWDYDLVALTFVAVWLATNGIKNGFQPWEKILLALTVGMPLILSQVASATHLQIAPLILWSMLVLTVHGATVRNRISAVAAS